jgi:hypothetical protein
MGDPMAARARSPRYVDEPSERILAKLPPVDDTKILSR